MSVPVLLLDAAWRIDRVIGVEHACTLIFEGQAVAASPETATVMRSPSTEIVVPSVIARTRMVSRPAKSVPGCTPRRVRQRDRHICQFVVDGVPCDQRGDSVDHLHPSSLGGANTWTNLVASCKRHNHVKAARPFERMVDGFGWGLRQVPMVPTGQQLLVASIGAPRPEWLPFLTGL